MDLTHRLGQKEAKKDRYVRLYAHLDDSEVATYLDDLKYQAQTLRLLLDSLEAEIAGKKEQQHLAETTEAWLITLRERIVEVESDTAEAQATRRELVRLLIEAVEVDRTEDGRTRVRTTYRFGPPADAGSSAEHRNGETEGDRVHVQSHFFGLENTGAHALMVASLAGVIALVLFTIAAMDNPFSGGARIDTGAFELVLNRFETSKLSHL